MRRFVIGVSAALLGMVAACGDDGDTGGSAGHAGKGGSGGSSGGRADAGVGGAGMTSGSAGQAGSGSGAGGVAGSADGAAGSGGTLGSAGSGGSAGNAGSAGSAGSAGAAPCDQTLSPGSNLPNAVSKAPNDSTICLNDGDYGQIQLFDIARSGFVTLRSTTGTGATLSPQVGHSTYIRFQNLTISGSLVNSCSAHITFLNTPFTKGLLITNNGATCPSGSQDYLVDGARFEGLGMATYEGRLDLVQVDGGVIKNSFFGKGGVSDGVQLLGGTKNSVVGPGNVFDGIRQSICDAGGGAHCDAIQLYGAGANNSITGNYFKTCDTFIMSPDGDTAQVTNNVFDGSGVSYLDKIQFGSAQSPVFRHNTVRDVRVSFDSKTGSPATSRATAQDNIMIGSSSFKTTNGNGCSSCTFSFNLFDDAPSASGTNNVIGTPVFTGGVSPATWQGFKLASGSPGKNGASDGADMGTSFFGP